MEPSALTQTMQRKGARPLHLLLFFVVAPVTVAFIQTFFQLSVMADGTLLISLSFALLFNVPGTLSAWATTSVVARLPGARRLPLSALLMIGFALSLLVFRPYNGFIYDLIPLSARQIGQMSGSSGEQLPWQGVQRFLFINVPGMIIWTVLNLLFIAKLGFPSYGLRWSAPEPGRAITDYAEAQSAGLATAVLPEFCRDAGITALDDLWVISAEEHYLRLRGRFGARMIRHSFGAALDQLPSGQGLQVHRSHWVAFHRVAEIETGKNVQLRLVDGTVVPVSNSYRQTVMLTKVALLIEEKRPFMSL